VNKFQQALAPTHTELAGLGLHTDTRAVLIVARSLSGGVANSSAIQGVQEGAEFYKFIDSPQRLTITSDSASDSAGGAGSTKILIQGLDANYKPIQEFVIPNGLNPVLTTQTFLRVQTATTIDAGAAAVNIGNISLTSEITTDRMGYISAGLGRSVVGNYTVPANKRLLIRTIFASTSRNDETEVYYTQRNFGNTAFLSTPAGIIYNSFGQINDIDLALPAKADFTLTMSPLVNAPKIVISIIANLYDFNENPTNN
tara:strand:- start:119 stop:886 length:768 start_codon:yes stop_codon:yes gene_type:complete